MLRPRPDGGPAAERVAGLLTPAPGWVLPGEEEVQDAAPAESEARSWQPVDRDPVLPRPTWRLDPGRRAAAALVAVAALAAVVAVVVVQRGRPQEVPLPVVEAVGTALPGETGAAGPAPDPAVEVVVAVGGKVRSPGLVRLPGGSRVDDAVRAAGGALDGVDTGLLNLARRLVDGELVLVGVDPPPGSEPAGAVAGGLLDLNSASVAQLEELPGVGPVLAQRIVDWRTENGRFASVDQLREVKGIGEATFADLEPKVAV